MSEHKELKDAFEHREKRGLLSAFSEEEDLLFMSEVDAAIHRKGSSIAFVLTVVIALFLIIFVLWAHFTVLDEVTRGLGQVIPSQKVQMIQNLEGGILQEITVQENQIVNKGDILIRIDNAMAASQYRDAFTKAAEHEAAIVRLNAEIEGKSKIVFPDEFKDADPQVLDDQQSIFMAHRQQLQAELNVLRSQHSQRQQ